MSEPAHAAAFVRSPFLSWKGWLSILRRIAHFFLRSVNVQQRPLSFSSKTQRNPRLTAITRASTQIARLADKFCRSDRVGCCNGGIRIFRFGSRATGFAINVAELLFPPSFIAA